MAELTTNTRDLDKITENKTGHVLKKRAPQTARKGKFDVYVSRKTNFKAHFKKCEKLLDDGASEIFIHALGAAITRACHLGLQLKENHKGTLDIQVTTSTVDLVDDLVPSNEDEDFEINERKNSVIQIRVFKTAITGPLRFKK